MGWIGRLVRWSTALLLIVVAVFWPLVITGSSSAGAVTDPVTFSNYRAEYFVDRDGNLDATETITADFPGGRHGIFRFWDVANRNSPHVRQPPLITSITVDGQSAQFGLSSEEGGRFAVAKIGDPDTTLPYGTHTYVVRYKIPGVLDPGNIGAGKRFASSTVDPAASVPDPPSVFFWNVVAPGWNNYITHAEISVTVPGEVTGAQCAVGSGDGTACDGLTVKGDTMTVSASELAPRTPVTVRVGVDVLTPPRAEIPWDYTWDRILGRSETGVLWVLLLTVVAAGIAWAMGRATTERPPAFPLRYAPPDGLGPVQFEYIRTESVGKNALTATLFYLAERGLVTLKQDSDTKWSIRGSGGDWASVDPVSAAVGSALKVMTSGSEFHANGTVTSGQKLTRAKAEMTVAVRRWAIDEKLIAKRRGELWVRAANVLAFFWLIMAAFLIGFSATMWVLPFAVFFFISVRVWAPGVGTRRTPAGRELWSWAGGFHRMLATDSAESRFDFGARKDLYATYVPFAVAAGAAGLWAKKYQTATGTVAPQPGWYPVSTGYSYSSGVGSGGTNFDSFDSALSSSIGAYTASQSSSSSSGGGSFGGGGSGGGGGGGGGGGSW